MCTGQHPFIPATNTARVDMIYSTAGGIAENVYHVRFPANPGPADLTDLAALFADWEADEARNNRSSSIALSLIKVKDLTTVESEGIEYAIGLPLPGVLASPVMPNSVTAAVKWTTGFTGRSRRGRTFIIGLSEAQCIGDQLASGDRTALRNNYQALLDRIGTAGQELVVVSYCNNGAWRAAAQVTPILACSLEGTLDVQRRRLLGRGQ